MATGDQLYYQADLELTLDDEDPPSCRRIKTTVDIVGSVLAEGSCSR